MTARKCAQVINCSNKNYKNAVDATVLRKIINCYHEIQNSVSLKKKTLIVLEYLLNSRFRKCFKSLSWKPHCNLYFSVHRKEFSQGKI